MWNIRSQTTLTPPRAAVNERRVSDRRRGWAHPAENAPRAGGRGRPDAPAQVNARQAASPWCAIGRSGPRMRPAPVPVGDRTLTGTKGRRKLPPGGLPRQGEGRQRRGGAARAGPGWLALATLPSFPLRALSGLIGVSEEGEGGPVVRMGEGPVPLQQDRLRLGRHLLDALAAAQHAS